MFVLSNKQPVILHSNLNIYIFLLHLMLLEVLQVSVGKYIYISSQPNKPITQNLVGVAGASLRFLLSQ